MDLLILEKAFALRDEARKADLAEESLDPALTGGTETRQPARRANHGSKLAAGLMRRAIALQEEASKIIEVEDHSSRAAFVELLKAASAELPEFAESDLFDRRPKVTEAGDNIANRESAASADLEAKKRIPKKKAKKPRATNTNPKAASKVAGKREKSAGRRKKKS